MLGSFSPDRTSFEKVKRNFTNGGRELENTLAVALQRWGFFVAGHIKEQKLSGAVLHVRSGLLRSSVRPLPVEHMGGGRLRERIQAGAGAGAVRYAAIHEYGGTIQHPGGTAFFFNTGRKGGEAIFISNKAAGSGWPEGLRTKPHPIHIPARPYMRPSLDETRPTLERYVHQALEEAFRAV